MKKIFGLMILFMAAPPLAMAGDYAVGPRQTYERVTPRNVVQDAPVSSIRERMEAARTSSNELAQSRPDLRDRVQAARSRALYSMKKDSTAGRTYMVDGLDFSRWDEGVGPGQWTDW